LVGFAGSLHSDIAAQWELRGEVVVAEIGIDRILGETAAARRFRPLPRYPDVPRDISIYWDEARTAGELSERIQAAAGPLLRSLVLADRYMKPPVPAGRVSLTVALRFQDPERTLTGDEVQAAIDRVTAALRAEGAEIRGE
jgi:phenylalanyl-tRNA synthetase beta chain